MLSGSLKTCSSVPSSISLTGCMRISWNRSSRPHSSIRKIPIRTSVDVPILNRPKNAKINPNYKKSATPMSSSPPKLSTSWAYGMPWIKTTKPQTMPSSMTSSKRPKSPSLKMIKSSSSSSHKKKNFSVKITRIGFRNYQKSKRNHKKRIIRKTPTKRVRNPSDQNKKSLNLTNLDKTHHLKFLFLPKIKTRPPKNHKAKPKDKICKAQKSPSQSSTHQSSKDFRSLMTQKKSKSTKCKQKLICFRRKTKIIKKNFHSLRFL